MHAKIFAKFKIYIDGIYGWGAGYLKHEFVERWDNCMESVSDYGPYRFKSSHLELHRNDLTSSSPEFTGSGMYAYMHPMEIAGEASSSEYCPSDNEGENFGRALYGDLEKVADIIRENFPDVANLKFHIVVKCYKVELDNPDYTIE